MGASTTGVDYGSGVLWPEVLVALSGRQLYLLNNAGMGGNTMVWMLGRAQADAVSYNTVGLRPAVGNNEIPGVIPLVTNRSR